MASCWLLPCDRRHEAINLPNGQAVVLGRGATTLVEDKKCDVRQVELTAIYEREEVLLCQIGSTSCSVGDKKLAVGETYKLGAGGCFCLLADSYRYFAHFGHQPTGWAKSSGTSTDQSKNNDCKSTASNYLESDDENPTKHRKCEYEVQDTVMDSGCPSVISKRDSKLENTQDKDKDHSMTANVTCVRQQQSTRTHPSTLLDYFGKQNQPSPGHTDVKQSLSATGNGSTVLDRQMISHPVRGVMSTEECWEELQGLVVFTSKGVQPSNKIAGFDLDGTIIVTKSGRVFPQGPSDWKLQHPNVKSRVMKLHSQGYKVVIFTNQLAVGNKKISVSDFLSEVRGVASSLAIPIQVFASTSRWSMYRKPCPGMWNFLRDKRNGGISIDLTTSFFVGDAAGRSKGWAPGRKSDFSCSDRKFALNVGLDFFTPEEYFLAYRRAGFSLGAFDPRRAVNSSGPVCDPPDTQIVSKSKEVVVLVGLPGSGKSTFATRYLTSHGYYRVNRDHLGSWQKCVQLATASLQQGKSIVVDNTSPDVSSRARYVEVAHSANVLARCFLLTTSYEQSKHNNFIRGLNPSSDHKPVDELAYNSYKSKFMKPSLSEGFSEVVNINFVSHFSCESDRELYGKFLI